MPATSAGMTGRGTVPLVLFDVERLGSGRLARGIEGDLLDPGLGLAQQFHAATLERLAALVDRDRLLERHLALLEPLDDRFELLDRLLEGQARDVGVVRHDPLPADNDGPNGASPGESPGGSRRPRSTAPPLLDTRFRGHDNPVNLTPASARRRGRPPNWPNPRGHSRLRA